MFYFFFVCSDVGVTIADFAIRGFTHKHVQWKHHCSNVCDDLFSSRVFMRSGLSSIFQCTALSLSMMVVGGWMWMGVVGGGWWGVWGFGDRGWGIGDGGWWVGREHG